jgi:predicted nucleotidyltransferase
VFGSLEAPWFGEDSDVDLAIEGVGPSDLYELERCLLDLLEVPVDLFLMEELEPSFKEVIEREGRRLL